MFRLPYRRSPFDLVPEALRSARQIDYAEALFGFVRTQKQLRDELGPEPPEQGGKGRAYAGRVIVTDAVLQPDDQEDIWLAEDFKQPITPRILASPKPTAFQHYLTQQQPDNQRALDHYDSGLAEGDSTTTTEDDLATTIRGHKLYWHQGLGTDLDLDLEQIRARISEKFDQVEKEQKDTQHTRMKPLKPGVTFSFRVSFENLSARELGALCWTLHPRGEPKQRYCHHLGMGKPLGMGAVELHARLHLIDRPQRYSTLFNGDSWQLGEALIGEDLALPDVLERWTKPFEEHLLHELNPSPECEDLKDMRRIALLLKLLTWPGYRPVEAENNEDNRYLRAEKRPNTHYMTIQPENEYRRRFVLPDPTEFDPLYFNGKARPQDSACEARPTNDPDM